jgi:hypothetical protein
MEYVATGILADLKPMAKMAFAFIKKEIDANIEKYNETCKKRSEAGKNGNKKRWGKGDDEDVAKIANAISASQKSQSIANIADNDNDNDYKEKVSKDTSKKGSKKIDASKIKNISAEFIPLMQTWFDYKQSRREMYKTMQSASVCYKSLYDLSNGNPTMAERIINQSIANNWAGLFEIKTTSNGTTFKSYQQIEREHREEQDKQFADHIRQKLAVAMS